MNYFKLFEITFEKWQLYFQLDREKMRKDLCYLIFSIQQALVSGILITPAGFISDI